jgi:hypothetical protein
MTLPRPNLFLIGSMKSGTTYLRDLLAQHPAIFMCLPKEPCYFVDSRVLRREWPYMWRHGYWRSADRYLRLFADAGGKTIIGEASTVYSQIPLYSGVPERIEAFSPNARFIYIMRDPVDRAISHYWFRVRWWREQRPMLTALRNDPYYRNVSHYARQLQEYVRHFGLERIYALTYEALVADPLGELNRMYGWLGVDPTFQPTTLGVATNVRPDVVNQVRGYGLLDRLRRTSLYARLAPYLPRAARNLGGRLAAHSVRPAEVPVGEVLEYLRPLQLRETEELRALLNRSFPEWRTLYGAGMTAQPSRYGDDGPGGEESPAAL